MGLIGCEGLWLVVGWFLIMVLDCDVGCLCWLIRFGLKLVCCFSCVWFGGWGWCLTGGCCFLGGGRHFAFGGFRCRLRFDLGLLNGWVGDVVGVFMFALGLWLIVLGTSF